MDKSIIEIRNLDYKYPDGTVALHDIHLDIFKNDKIGIIGPNGAGKTTLLLHLNGLLNGSGAIKISDLDLVDKNLNQIRKDVGLVFQDPEDQLFMPTVAEDVGFGPKNLGFKKQDLEDIVDNALDEVELKDKKEHLSYHLSFGEKKRIAIACVLSMKPKILLLDEPSSNLDPHARRQIIKLLRKFNSTVIIASHDLELILELCQRVIILDKGRVVSDGKTRHMLSDENLLESHGLELPLSIRYKN
ncbi:MAG: ABC transporter ATP-binding protein [Candidatus Omnitrophota bacterium]